MANIPALEANVTSILLTDILTRFNYVLFLGTSEMCPAEISKSPQMSRIQHLLSTVGINCVHFCTALTFLFWSNYISVITLCTPATAKRKRSSLLVNSGTWQLKSIKNVQTQLMKWAQYAELTNVHLTLWFTGTFSCLPSPLAQTE